MQQNTEQLNVNSKLYYHKVRNEWGLQKKKKQFDL